jgi:hypothetical protein
MVTTRTASGLHPTLTQGVVRWPNRPLLITVEGVISLAGFAGSVQLLTGIATPPDADLPPHLSTWALPALWLFTSVSLPAAVASWLAWRCSAHAPAAVMVASAALAVELAVQVPFVGFNILQVAFGLLAGLMALVALDARRRGWGTLR